MLDPATVDHYAELGVGAVVQPISIESERRWLASRLGPDRIDRVYPYRRLLDAGVVVAGMVAAGDAVAAATGADVTVVAGAPSSSPPHATRPTVRAARTARAGRRWSTGAR